LSPAEQRRQNEIKNRTRQQRVRARVCERTTDELIISLGHPEQEVVCELGAF